ncbi:MAG: DUF2269 domain-containing protein [Burkholderiaceae bacterium]|nr:DUF2269 domain-containing protein [Burkholderiaceae bacterium]
MSIYLVLKWLHVLSSTVLFGTGIGIAFFKWMADRGGDVATIRRINEITVFADWVFTTPAVIAQPASGLGLMLVEGYPMSTPWIVAGFALYFLAGACWLPVVWLQLEMRNMARRAERDGGPLPQRYRQLARRWFFLGMPAFTALAIVFWLMVAKPALW